LELFGKEASSPSPPAKVSEEHCKIPNEVWGKAPATQRSEVVGKRASSPSHQKWDLGGHYKLPSREEGIMWLLATQ